MSLKILIADDEIKANKVVQKSYKEQINNLVDFAGDGREALKNNRSQSIFSCSSFGRFKNVSYGGNRINKIL
ncbi:MAG: response regulator [Pleurocapsa sp. CRU_1_2]|nr:response regulator [Pleurocapsa sp. CRU_1_2]